MERSTETRVRAKGVVVQFGLGIGVGIALLGGMAGCHKTPADAAPAVESQSGADPADVNMAAVSGGSTYSQPTSSAATTAPSQPARVLGQRQQNESQQAAEDYSQQQQGAPIVRQDPSNNGQAGYAPDQGQDPTAGQMSETQAADLYASDLTDQEATEPPPPLPTYEQPPAPEPNYLWTPGYWAYGAGGYYWVPGLWAAPPYVGALWTPGYWGGYGPGYRFHHGFWGLHIGFYGGINYGFGYTGRGYYGGYWRGNNFTYNTAVNRVNVTVIHNTYIRNVTVVTNNQISYNGGRGGVGLRPAPAEIAVLHEQRTAPMQGQIAARQKAAGNRAQFFNENKGRPAVFAAARPVAADRTLAAPLPRPNLPAPAAVRAQGPETRPGQPGPQHAGPTPLEQHMQQPGGPVQRPNASRGPEGPAEPNRPQPQHVNPAPQPQHVNPAPQPQHVNPAPQPQHVNPAPTPQHVAPSAPQPQHVNPAPQPQHVNPAPQPQHVNPAPQPQHVNPAPQPQRAAPAPQQEHTAPAPQPQRTAPAPQPQHANPPPAAHPEPHEEGGRPRH